MSSVDVALWCAVVVLALAAGRMSLPKPPALDWREFFSLGFVTQIRGKVDSEGGDFESWVARCEPLIGRGESDATYDDPADFGSDYALSRSLGAGADWELLASDSSAVAERLSQRGEALHWVCRGGAMSEALQEILPQVVCLDGPEEELLHHLEGLLVSAASRVVLVGEGKAAQEWTRLLHAEEGLRDRTLAVVGIQGLLDSEWMAENFDHESMDTELERLTPWFQLSFNGDGEARGWPQPDPPPSERVSVDAVELGPMPCKRADAPDAVWALALVLTLSHRLALES